MQNQTLDFDFNNLILSTQQSAKKKVFAQAMKGVFSAVIKRRKFKYGKPDEGPDYRRFYYNKNGDVVKRILFNEGGESELKAGDIDMKEHSEYDDKGNLLLSRFITPDNIVREEYQYNDEGHMVGYTLVNPKLPPDKRNKRAANEYDEKGRLRKTTSYGLMGTPEYISHYLYADEADENYAFKHVTRADGSLVMTFYFTYEAGKKQRNTTGIYGFYLPPDELMKLLKESKDDSWKLESAFSSVWEYNKDGKPVSFVQDERVQKTRLDTGDARGKERVETERSTMEYGTINGKPHLVKITEWQTRFNEPKEIKEYTYYDEADNPVFPSDEEDKLAAAAKKKGKQ